METITINPKLIASKMDASQTLFVPYPETELTLLKTMLQLQGMKKLIYDTTGITRAALCRIEETGTVQYSSLQKLREFIKGFKAAMAA